MKKLLALAASGVLTVATLVSAAPAYADEGPFTLRYRETGHCLQTGPSGAVYTENCAGQTWTLISQPSTNTFQIRHTATGRCVAEGTGGAVASTSCTTAGNQRWRVRISPVCNGVLLKSPFAERFLVATSDHRVFTTFGGSLCWLTS